MGFALQPGSQTLMSSIDLDTYSIHFDAFSPWFRVKLDHSVSFLCCFQLALWRVCRFLSPSDADTLKMQMQSSQWSCSLPGGKKTSTVRETKDSMLMGRGMRGRQSPGSFLVPEEAPPLLSCVLLPGANELCLFMDQLMHNRKYLLISIQTT